MIAKPFTRNCMGEGIRVAGLRLQGAGYRLQGTAYRLQGTGRMRCRVQAANYKESYRSCLFGFWIFQFSGFLWFLSFGSWFFPAVFLRISDFPVFGLFLILAIWFLVLSSCILRIWDFPIFGLSLDLIIWFLVLPGCIPSNFRLSIFGLSSVLIIWFFQKPYLSSSKNINTVL